MTAIGAVNAIAARIAVDAGFGALWLSSLEASADIDNGGGTVAFSRRVAFELGASGVAGSCFEDSAYPRVSSFATHRTQRLADVKLTGAQLQVIRETAGPQLVLIARTETLVCGGAPAGAVERAEGYAAAGADAVLRYSNEPSGRQSLEVAAQWPGTVPLVVVTTAFPHLSLEELGAAGFALAIYASQLSRAALAAMRDVTRTFAGTGRFLDSGPASVQDLFETARPETVG